MEICNICKAQNPGFETQVDLSGDQAEFCKNCGAVNSREVIEDLASIVQDECESAP